MPDTVSIAGLPMPMQTEAAPLDVADQPIRIHVEEGDETHMVRISGELDAASREWVARSCTESRAAAVTVDLSKLTFLDCGGYGAFVTARTTLERLGRTLVIVGAVGEPRRLLDLIDLLSKDQSKESRP